MSKTLGVVLAFVGVAVFSAVSLILSYIGFSNTANGFEVDIKAKYDNNRNVYDNGWKKVVEVAQVPALQTEALRVLYKDTMEGRYGKDGSKAMMQWITEHNPQLNQSTFIRIQQDIEAFRIEFAGNQTGLVSKKQEYERFLRATTAGRLFNTFGGYPHIDLTKFDIVTSDKTEKDFETKRSAPLDLKGGK